jgi:hypothetical protein
LKQINKGRGTKTGGYSYEERKPSYGLNNGDVVILPAKQPPNKEHGDCVGKCLRGNLIVYVRTKTVTISDATVEINGPKTQSGNTDTVGKVAFKQIPPGAYKVIAKKDSLTAKGSAVVPAGDTKEITLILCVIYQLDKSFLIAKAIDTYLTPIAQFPVGDEVLDLGQDVTHAANREAPIIPVSGILFPQRYSVGTDEGTLRNKMNRLLDVFAEGDTSGMAKRLFSEFMKKNKSIEVFTDKALDKAIEKHENFIAFSDRTLAAPGTQGTNPNRKRIHQALKEANWDINKVVLIDDLGVPAFNLGSKTWGTGDFSNGLGLMINGVQYVFVYVEQYDYNSCEQQYKIRLKFVLYDVFGLDDDDLIEFGASSDWNISDAKQGITAWWQLQHQFDYAPLITKAVIYKDYTVSTNGQ